MAYMVESDDVYMWDDVIDSITSINNNASSDLLQFEFSLPGEEPALPKPYKSFWYAQPSVTPVPSREPTPLFVVPKLELNKGTLI